MLNPATDPVLRRTIAAIVERRTRHLPAAEQREVRKDLTQELRLQVLELEDQYRGDNGASFATFIFRALALHAYHVLRHYERPVSAGRNNKAHWLMQRERPQHHQPTNVTHATQRTDPVDPVDVLESEGASPEDAVAEASVGAHLRDIARRHESARDREVIEAIVYGDESYESASARTGRPIRALRRVVRDYRQHVAEDRELKKLYAR